MNISLSEKSSLNFWVRQLKGAYIRHALADGNGDGLSVEAVCLDGEADDAGLGVDGLVLVEDEVAYAVVDLLATIVFDGLEGVGVVADQNVCPSLNQLVGFQSLTRHRLQRMFASPMERNDDNSRGISLAKTKDTIEERVHGLLTDAGLVCQIRIVL